MQNDLLRAVKPEQQEAEEKDHEHKEGEEHEHSHGGIFGKNTELIFSHYLWSIVGHWIGLSFIETFPSWVSLSLYIAAYFFHIYCQRSSSNSSERVGFD